MSYQIKLKQFEGPIDLLLFFIHRDKINIYDIPISHITKEFLGYIDMMKVLEVAIGGEFIVMASTLMQIKAKMLLPKSEQIKDDENYDPRKDLVEKILEYKLFKESADKFKELYDSQSLKYNRGDEIIYSRIDSDLNLLSDVNLLVLMETFRDLINNLPENYSYELNEEKINMNDQIEIIRSFFGKKKFFNFSELLNTLSSKLSIVITFISLLEMLKNEEIKIKQKKSFGEIKIMKVH